MSPDDIFSYMLWNYQIHEGVKHPLLYASKKLIPREQNYSVGERVALAIIWAVKKFQRYVYGQQFTLEKWSQTMWER